MDWGDWLTSWDGVAFPNGSFCLLDEFWPIIISIVCQTYVVLPYIFIAWIWHKASQVALRSEAKNGFILLKWIFIFCACCGYAWPIIHLVWPAYKLYWGSLIVLGSVSTYFVIRYRFILTDIILGLVELDRVREGIKRFKSRG